MALSAVKNARRLAEDGSVRLERIPGAAAVLDLLPEQNDG